jgi:hypothetical protein
MSLELRVNAGSLSQSDSEHQGPLTESRTQDFRERALGKL